MTDEQATEIRNMLRKAVDFFEPHQDFPAVQVEIHDRIADLMKEMAVQPFNTEERMQSTLKIVDIYAEVHLRLVADMDSQKAFRDILTGIGFLAGEAYAGVALEHMFILPQNVARIQGRVNHWINEGFKYLVSLRTSASQTTFAPQAESRKGYRAEVRAWMKHEGIRSVEKAAKRLAVSGSTLKSIMSNKGDVRYSHATLTAILKKIGYPDAK